MTPDELRAKVERIKTFRRAPLRGTMVTARGDVPIVPQMSDAEYRQLVARGGMQAWTPEDERELAWKVRRVRR